MAPSLPSLLAHAREAARVAAEGIGAKAPIAISTKTTATDLVTEFDVLAEQLIRAELAVRTPALAVVGEEGGGQEAEAYWSVDPIDGTVNFAHGLPIWAISIGLVRQGRPVAGVVLAPALGQEFFAAEGMGAFLVTARGLAAGAAPQRLRVSATPTLATALLATGFPYDLVHPDTNNFRQWEALHRASHACRRLGAASLDLCYVAAGWFDGFWERELHPWDVAAAAIVLAEAGGRLTEHDGGAGWLRSGDVVASNGALHHELRAALAATRRA